MNNFEKYRKTIAIIFKIVGGIFLVAACAVLCSDLNWRWAKLLFCCALGPFETGRIIARMVPGQNKSDRRKSLIGIALLMCCTLIAAVFLMSGCTTYVFLPVTIGLVGDIIGQTNDENTEAEVQEN